MSAPNEIGQSSSVNRQPTADPQQVAEQPTNWVDSLHNQQVAAARETKATIPGAEIFSTTPKLGAELAKAGAQQSSLGKVTAEPLKEIVDQVDLNDTTGRGFLNLLKFRKSRLRNQPTEKAA